MEKRPVGRGLHRFCPVFWLRLLPTLLSLRKIRPLAADK